MEGAEVEGGGDPEEGDRPLPTHGMASYEKKGEDCVSVSVSKGDAVYGVFDGHGGAALARACSSHAWRRSSIKERFWKLDEKLGPKRMSEGTTVGLVFVEPRDAEKGTHVTCAWCGDSQIMELDMLEPSGQSYWLSEAHDCDNAKEVSRMDRHWKVRDLLGGEATREVAEDKEAARVQAAAAKVASATGAPPEEADLLARSVDYERGVDAALKLVAPSQMTRSKSRVARRYNEWTKKRTGPLIVEATWTDIKGVQVVGASTSVTRSIGDWDSPRVLIPEPGVREAWVPNGAFKRYIIASDGLWTYVDTAKIAKVAHNRRWAYDAQECATRLLTFCRESLAKKTANTAHPFLDDTTIMVIDVLPDPDNTPRVTADKGTPGKSMSGMFSRNLSFGSVKSTPTPEGSMDGSMAKSPASVKSTGSSSFFSRGRKR